jgi:hypothetical protein
VLLWMANTAGATTAQERTTATIVCAAGRIAGNNKILPIHQYQQLFTGSNNPVLVPRLPSLCGLDHSDMTGIQIARRLP